MTLGGYAKKLRRGLPDSAAAGELLFSRLARFSAETEFMFRHAHPPAVEMDTLGFQPEPLLHAGFAGQGNSASGGHYPVPGKALRPAQRPYYLPGGARQPGGLRH